MIILDMNQISLASLMMHLNMTKTKEPDENMYNKSKISIKLRQFGRTPVGRLYNIEKLLNYAKSRNIFIITWISLVLGLMMMSSCGTTQITQKQVKINYKLDKLWIDYMYERDSLINEYYKDECENCDEID